MILAILRTKIVIKCFLRLIAGFVFLMLLSFIVFYVICGSDRESIYFNDQLKLSLAQKHDFDFISILKIDPKSHLLIIPPYTGIEDYDDWQCPGFRNQFLTQLKIKPTLHDNLVSFVFFNLDGVIKTINVSGESIFCDINALKTCNISSEINIKFNSDKNCFRIASEIKVYLPQER